MVKNPPANSGDCTVPSLNQEDPVEKKWQPTPIFLSGESHGQRSLAGYSPWGCKRARQYLETKQQQQNVGWSSGCYMISEYLPKDFSLITKGKVSLQWRDLPESCLTKPSSLASLSDQGTQWHYTPSYEMQWEVHNLTFVVCLPKCLRKWKSLSRVQLFCDSMDYTVFSRVEYWSG